MDIGPICDRRKPQHGWLAACSTKSRRAQRRRAGGARRMRRSHPVPRALGVHPCPTVAGDCSRRRSCRWWPDLARQRQPRLRRVWRLVSRAGGSVVHHRPDAEQAVGLVGAPADQFSGRRHARARSRADRLLHRAGSRHCVLCRPRAGPTRRSCDPRRRACGSHRRQQARGWFRPETPNVRQPQPEERMRHLHERRPAC